MTTEMSSSYLDSRAVGEVDVLVVGAGFGGLYALYRLRELGYSVQVLEQGEGVGGTWYWNRYPGARCDVESMEYSYSFSPELEQEWEWTERYPTQPEILRYLNHVADRFDLRRDIRLGARVVEAAYDGAAGRWMLTLANGERYAGRYFVAASGCLSSRLEPAFTGIGTFGGDWYHTAAWPKDGVDFTGKRVGVVGTGSTGIQAIPQLARQADQLYVFQRTPNFSVPAQNRPLSQEFQRDMKARYRAHRQAAKESAFGVPVEPNLRSALDLTPEEADAELSARWADGGGATMMLAFADLLTDERANEVAAEFVRAKIREIVKDQRTAEMLCPADHPLGTKRICVDIDYYATYNRDNVTLVDVRSAPIEQITPAGLRLTDGQEFELDAIVFAIGFDAMTGALFDMNLRGRDGRRLEDQWAEGPRTYLGLMTTGYPNLFIITGPGSPSVLSNMVVSVEQHVDWIADLLVAMRERGRSTVEPTAEAEESWSAHCTEIGNSTLFPRAKSWYTGQNVPGKPFVFMPYVGGVGPYRQVCAEVAARGYPGLSFDGPPVKPATPTPIHPRARELIDMFHSAGTPPLAEATVEESRSRADTIPALIGPGPEIGEVCQIRIPGPAGEIPARVYRPDGPPLATIVYLHGGGWVVGSLASFDPFTRVLVKESGCKVVSVDYRLAPEHRFPHAVEDAFAALKWVASNLAEGPLLIGGDSAGGNLAAVCAIRARDEGGPELALQILAYPVTDHDFETESYREQADNPLLSRSDMIWFWDHYLPSEADRDHPDASPLRAGDLSGLPPAYVVAAAHDPLRDEVLGYAERLEHAGVPVTLRTYGDQAHGFMMMVNFIPTADESIRDLSRALQKQLGAVQAPTA